MKTFFPVFLAMFFCVKNVEAQISSPVTRANFGVDGDLRSNFTAGAVDSARDDWFTHPSQNSPGRSVIDTTGAAAILARYATDMPFRRLPFYRPMSEPPFSVINNHVWIDAVMIRDYHGNDSTVFANGANKNGDSPANWSCPVAQSIPDKNDILDMMIHLRRAGPTSTDSLWLFGGVSLDNTNGNRYLDFELYQTDIFYDRNSRKFSGYGPDDGHTSWEFDAAGNVTKAGDIIFNAEYQSSALTLIEARIWVNQASLSITPAAFDWNGAFDGASNGSTYGYANIRPKQSGTYYTGLAGSANNWAGPFGVIQGDESLITDYAGNQFVEFSVNLSKLGLDGAAMLGGSNCTMPFRRILVKTRASSSFTAELKDFVGPFDFFLASRAEVATETPLLCTGGVAHLEVTNPVAGSIYQWSTPDGNMVTSPDASSVYVDQPGTYIVTQTLQSGCDPYATDTIDIVPMTGCTILSGNQLFDAKGRLQGQETLLQWKVRNNVVADHFEIERSSDGQHFQGITSIQASALSTTEADYRFSEMAPASSSVVYYRIVLVNKDGSRQLSAIIPISVNTADRLTVYPNPAVGSPKLQITMEQNTSAKILVYQEDGRLIYQNKVMLQKGLNSLQLHELTNKPAGNYLVVMQSDKETVTRKFILLR